MNSSSSQQPDWQIENGAIVAGGSFIFLTVLFSLIFWHIKIPFVNDLPWTNWTQLRSAIFGYTMSLAGIDTRTWAYLDYVLKSGGTDKLFKYHFFAPFIIALPLAVLMGYVAAQPRDKFHAGGRELLIGNRAIRFAQKFLKKNSPRNAQIPGLLVHPYIRLNSSQETKGLAFIGSPGSGKTQIILSLLLDAIEKQSAGKFFVLDNKGDFTALFLDNESILLAPWDKRSAAWNIGCDIVTELDAGLFSKATIQQLSGDNSVFADAACVTLTGFIVCLQHIHGTNWGWTQLAACLEWPLDKITAEFSQYYPVGLKIMKEDSKATDSVLFTMTANLSFIRHLAHAWPNSQQGFSLRDWLKDDTQAKQIILLQVNKAYPSLSDPFCCAVLSVLTQLVLSPELPDSSTRRLHFVLDEIAQIPKVDQLKNLSALGRSKGVCVWLGIQDFDLLVKSYGQHDVNALIGMLQTQIILQMGAGTGSEFASKLLSERNVYVGDLSEQNASTSIRTEKQNLVNSSEINALLSPTLESGIQGWLAITGWSVILKLNWPIQDYTKQREGVELADWVIITAHKAIAESLPDHTDSSANSKGKKRLVKKALSGEEGTL